MEGRRPSKPPRQRLEAFGNHDLAPGAAGAMIPNDPIEHLISLLSRLPGLGRRSARRAVLKMLMDPRDKMLPLADALRRGARAAALVCEREGADPPTRVELDAAAS